MPPDLFDEPGSARTPRRRRVPSAMRGATGRLRIGDDWNAITIIALSQSNPLKAIAEFVENSIDAGAQHITVVRGRERGEHYLAVIDDGQGVPRDAEGLPDFRYVATHICDSIKRRLKATGSAGLQGEFGIGLLSFWTVGEELTLTSAGSDGKLYQMHMRKGDPGYRVVPKRALFEKGGTALRISPLLSGVRQLNGEKIQWYLASELRERIRQSGVEVRVVDRHARREFKVEPREFEGQLLHGLPLPVMAVGDLYIELYLTTYAPTRGVGLYRNGTRILGSLTELEGLNHAPWSSGCLLGIIDAPALNITPATRLGIIHDETYSEFMAALQPLEAALNARIEEQQRAEDERASRDVLRTIQSAFREALLQLPPEEYDWFEVAGRRAANRPGGQDASCAGIVIDGSTPKLEREPLAARQRQFFEYAGPLYSVRIAPGSSVVPVGTARSFRAVPRDRTRQLVEDNLGYAWAIAGGGQIDRDDGEIVTFAAPAEPGLTRLSLRVTQSTISCTAESLITVTDSLLPESKDPNRAQQGLPGYTYYNAPGELWRSRFDAEQNVIVINNGHRDFVYASRGKSVKLRYLTRLFAKEMVQKNFPGLPADQLLERMIELSLYTEEHLR
ncbi:MAG: ATP-binding protein [Gammaproteobacteria bacterium]|nr:ATP-binding protein [Gammaproteobacteria bacterium]